MLRVTLAVALAFVIGGIGFYLGRSTAGAHAAPPFQSSGAHRAPAVESGAHRPPAAESHRSRTTPPPAKSGPSRIALPIDGLTVKDILDTFDDARGTDRTHEATDIMAPAGTPVLAVDDGTIRKLFDSKAGGLTIYHFDPDEKVSYYYAHLQRYAADLEEGQKVKRGDVIGYVGSTGNADPSAPHLHFAIFELGPGKEWYSDLKPVNPYPLLMEALEKRQAYHSTPRLRNSPWI